MSGIFGIVNVDGAPVERAALEALTGFMRSSGPDAASVWVDGAAGFGHTLLATREAGTPDVQPCRLEPGLAIVADARIDARDDLLGKLGGADRTGLRDASDAELILHAYRRWGDECVDHLLGDFAFAIWDARKRRLFCARDHFGVKPFFHAFDGRRFVFANVLECVRRFPGVSARLDELSIADFLMFEMNQDPAATAFMDIKRLAPAHCFELRSAGPRIRRYWSLPQPALRYRGGRDEIEGFRDILGRAVADRVTTHRTAIMMSGGLDSTTIAAVALESGGRAGRAPDLRAFATVHDRLIPDEERHYSRIAAGHLGIPIEYGEADAYALYERFDELGAYFPEPANEPHAAMTVDLARRAAAHARVILTGWDGDALLSESPRPYLAFLLRNRQWMRAAYVATRYAITQRRIVPRAGWTVQTPRDRAAASPPPFPRWIPADLAERLALRERWAAVHARPRMTHPLRPYAHHVLDYIGQRSNFFDGFTPACTGAAAEFRHPFLDLRVVEFCLSLPPFPWCHRKELMRRAARGKLPDEIRLRAKTPLAGFPYLELLARDESRWVDEFVACAPTRRYVERASLAPARLERDPDEAWALLRPLGLDLWLRRLHPMNTHREEIQNEFA